MNFLEAMNWVEGEHCFPKSVEDFHAERFVELCRLSGILSKLPKIVVVTGSCGKASTARFLAYILREEGLCVGLGTKPPLSETADGNRERYQLFDAKGEHWIDKDLFQKIVEPLPQLVQAIPKEFGDIAPYELRTWILLKAFCAWEVDIGIVEANIGLRNDPAGAIPADLTIVTPIGTDHSQLLQPPLEWQYLGQAAGPLWHKLSKIPSPRVVIGDQPMITAEQLDKLVDRAGPRMGRDFFIEDSRCGLWGGKTELSFGGLDCSLEVSCLGSFQLENAALAAVAFKELYPEGSLLSILNGVKKLQVPGRLEVVCRDPLELLCVATSKQKLLALFDALDDLWSDDSQKMVMVYSLLDRAHHREEIVETIACYPRLRALIVTCGSYQDDSRDVATQEIADLVTRRNSALKVIQEPQPSKAIAVARALQAETDLAVFLGNGIVAYMAEAASFGR